MGAERLDIWKTHAFNVEPHTWPMDLACRLSCAAEWITNPFLVWCDTCFKSGTTHLTNNRACRLSCASRVEDNFNKCLTRLSFPIGVQGPPFGVALAFRFDAAGMFPGKQWMNWQDEPPVIFFLNKEWIFTFFAFFLNKEWVYRMSHQYVHRAAMQGSRLVGCWANGCMEWQVLCKHLCFTLFKNSRRASNDITEAQCWSS